MRGACHGHFYNGQVYMCIYSVGVSRCVCVCDCTQCKAEDKTAAEEERETDEAMACFAAERADIAVSRRGS